MQGQPSGDGTGMTTEGTPLLGWYYDVAGARLLLHPSGPLPICMGPSMAAGRRGLGLGQLA